MTSSAVPVPNTILALQLLESVDVNRDQRSNILVHVDINNTDTVYDEMKTSIRLLKGNLVEKANEANEWNDDEEINYTRNEGFRQRSRSKSRQRFEDRSFDNHNESRNRSISRDRGKSNERARSTERRYSNERGRSNERRYSQGKSPQKDRSYSKNRNYGRRYYSKDRYRGKEYKRSYESVNLVFKETGEEAKAETRENIERMIVDSGTTKTVAGTKWMETYLESLPEEERISIAEESEDRFFRFGNSVRYPSKREITIPLKLGKLESRIPVYVVDASIPLLIGKPDLKRLGFIINFEDETVFTTRTFETFPLETTLKGHLALPIKNDEMLEDEVFLREAIIINHKV